VEGLPGSGKTTAILVAVCARLEAIYGPECVMAATIRGIVAVLSGAQAIARTFDMSGWQNMSEGQRVDAANAAARCLFMIWDEAQEFGKSYIPVHGGGRRFG